MVTLLTIITTVGYAKLYYIQLLKELMIELKKGCSGDVNRLDCLLGYITALEYDIKEGINDDVTQDIYIKLLKELGGFTGDYIIDTEVVNNWNVIGVTSGIWGSITGNIYNQTDLIELIKSNSLSIIQVTYSDLGSDHKTYTNVKLAGKNYVIFQAVINGFLTSPDYVIYNPSGGFTLVNEMVAGDILYLFGESFAYVFPEGVSEIYNALNRTTAGAVLDARQGKVLYDLLRGIGGLKIDENTPVAANEAAAIALQLQPYTLYITPTGEVRYKLLNGVAPNAPTNGIVDDTNDTFTFTGGVI